MAGVILPAEIKVASDNRRLISVQLREAAETRPAPDLRWPPQRPFMTMTFPFPGGGPHFFPSVNEMKKQANYYQDENVTF